MVKKFQSLADVLGVDDPQEPGRLVPELPKKLTAKTFCQDILLTTQYRESLLRRILMDELPPAIEALLYHYAYGKPIERVEMRDATDDVDEMDIDECEREAMRLLEIARQLRSEDDIEMDVDDRRIH